MPILNATLRSGRRSGFRFKLESDTAHSDLEIGKRFEATVLEADARFEHLVGKKVAFHPEILSSIPSLHFSGS